MDKANSQANSIYGELTAYVDMTGYTFERACQRLESLLSEGWKECGDGFSDVNEFLDSIRLDKLRALAVDRKRIAQRIKELQPEASNRQIAKTLGVSKDTVRGDISPPDEKKTNKSKGEKSNGGEISPSGPSGAELAAAAHKSAKAQEKRDAKRTEYADQIEQGGNVEDLEVLSASGKKFGVIYADPPWSFKVYSGKGKARSAERHYDTMDLNAICALPVAELAAEDSALFLWCVMPELPGALRVIKDWGFEYKTVAFTWVKATKKAVTIPLSGEGLHWGMGYWTRANCEICLLATRGSPTRIAMDVHQVILAPVGEHSAKPDEAANRIERLLTGPYLEMFARKERKGWRTWGNQVEALEYQEAAE